MPAATTLKKILTLAPVALLGFTACGSDNLDTADTKSEAVKEYEEAEGVTVPDATEAPDPSTDLERTARECGAETENIGDEGHTVLFDTEGEEDYGTGDDITTVACTLTGIDTPESMIARLDSTRALDGQQQGDIEGYHLTWSYHPDSGMNLIIEEAD